MSDNTQLNHNLLTKTRFSHLKLVLAIAEHGTLHKAAAEIAITQPALTRALRDLEQTLGVELFERSHQGMKLNTYGEQFAQHAQIMLNQFQSAVQHLDGIKEGHVGHVNIAMLPAAAPGIMPTVLQRLDAMQTGITLSLIGGVSRQLMPELIKGKLDMIVGRLPGENIPGLQQIPLLYDGFNIVCGLENKLLKKSRYKLKDLLDQHWIMPTDSDSLLMYDVHQTFARHALSLPTKVMQVSSLVAIRKILRTTDRISILSSEVAKDEEQFGLLKILPVEFEPVLTPIGITTRANEAISPTAQLLIELIEAVCREKANALAIT